MKIIVRAKPNAKEEKVERLTQPTLELAGMAKEPDVYKVSVKAPPSEGKANEAIVRALAAHFGTSASRVRLVSGARSKRKVFAIDE